MGADATVTLFVEPESKADIILNAIGAAQQSIWIEMYEFTDSNVANALMAKMIASPNIDLQLLYDPKSFPAVLSPDGVQLPSWAYQNKAVKADGSSPGYCHAKFMIIDGSSAYIMTANFTEAALGGTQEATNREYIICDTDSQDIQMLQAIFQADKQGVPLPASTAPNLVVTDISAHALIRALLDSAQQSIYMQVEALADPNTGGRTAQSHSVEGALLNAVQSRHLQDVKIMLPPLPGAMTTMLTVDNSAAISDLQSAPSIMITTQGQYYMHAKLIIVDQRLAFVGSQNFTRESLNYNREVGILIKNANVVKTLTMTFMADWAGTQAPQAAATSTSVPNAQ
jgi:phosphatidylserine/phosphatidylglycerophosphate/cardiolipin synthase-like enzyme